MKKAPCNDCGKDTQPETKVGRPLFKKYDTYIVRFEVWSQAGMDGMGQRLSLHTMPVQALRA